MQDGELGSWWRLKISTIIHCFSQVMLPDSSKPVFDNPGTVHTVVGPGSTLATTPFKVIVSDMGKFQLQGVLAWWFWKLIHIYFLIGVQSRLNVALSWLWNHSVGYRGSRLITNVRKEDINKSIPKN